MRRPSVAGLPRRDLGVNQLSGTVPSVIGELTALTTLCAAHAPRVCGWVEAALHACAHMAGCALACGRVDGVECVRCALAIARAMRAAARAYALCALACAVLAVASSCRAARARASRVSVCARMMGAVARCAACRWRVCLAGASTPIS